LAPTDRVPDHYEILQISPNAEPETVHRVYRLLAQRFHPDNLETGSPRRFKEVSEAYRVLSDPEQRARYDVGLAQRKKERWRMLSNGSSVDNDFELEHRVRLTALEVLYTQRRCEPGHPGLTLLDLEELLGRSREHLEFTVWFLTQKQYVTRSDGAVLAITAAGAEHLEQHYESNGTRLLGAGAAVEA
jgi:curved DNA-binding protein CbpA